MVGQSSLWNLVFISEEIIDFNLYYRGGALLFPLYLYFPKKKNNPKPGVNLMILFEPEAGYSTRKANINRAIYEKLENTFNKKPTPEEILFYLYSIFYSNIYRSKYAEFLKIDFPRIPFTSNYKLFKKTAGYGKQLADLHLLKSVALNNPVSKYHGSGDNDRIEKVEYDKKRNCVHINKEKYFDGITSELWDYQIGGYQVLHKFLKDRRGRVMKDPRRYSRIVTAISKTIDLQKRIDAVYQEIEKQLVNL